MKDYQEAFRQEFGIHFSESELQFALAFIEEVYQAGRGSILTELVHEERKFFDGFAHPKDCELCHLPDRPLNSEREWNTALAPAAKRTTKR